MWQACGHRDETKDDHPCTYVGIERSTSGPEGDAKIDIPDGGLAVENGDGGKSKWQLWVAMLIYLIWKASVT